MARPARNSNPREIARAQRTFFATTKTHAGRRLFQSARNANLLIDVLRRCAVAREFQLHDFVIMPDHVHLLVTVNDKMTIEKAMQLIKGRFSYLMKRDHGYLGEVWQRGFSEARAHNETSLKRYCEYIAENPTKAGLAASADEYPYCFAYLAKMKRNRG
jgi:putative transposase